MPAFFTIILFGIAVTAVKLLVEFLLDFLGICCDSYKAISCFDFVLVCFFYVIICAGFIIFAFEYMRAD